MMMIVYMYLYEHGYDCLRWPNGLIIYIGDIVYICICMNMDTCFAIILLVYMYFDVILVIDINEF